MKIEWKCCFQIGISIFILYLCIQYWPYVIQLLNSLLSAASPLILGGVLAYLVNILMSFYENKLFQKHFKYQRVICMLLAFISLIFVFILVIYLVVPELASCVKVIFSAVPAAIEIIVDFLDSIEIIDDNIINTLNSIDWQALSNQIWDWLMNGFGNIMNVVIDTFSIVFSSVVTILVGFIFSIYLLLGKEKLALQWNKLLHHYVKDEWSKKIEYVLSILNDCFSRYIVGQCIEAVILGLLCALGMMLLKLPYATMIGVLIAVTALIPVAGAYIGGGIGALMIFSVSPIQAIGFIIYLVILQQLEGNIIYPRVVGSSLGLPAIWILAAVTIGGGMMGVIGMLLAVPFAAALYRLIREDIHRKR
ncbi:MAG: AI-2E family transporter [Traorella sp.]